MWLRGYLPAVRTRWLPILAVVLTAATLVAYKQLHRTPAAGENPEEARAGDARGPSVLLFADPREADSEDACAEIFRLVRRAGAQGVRTRELRADKSPEDTRKYRVTVEPTVLILDRDGHEIARHEGESAETIRAIRASLERLPAR